MSSLNRYIKKLYSAGIISKWIITKKRLIGCSKDEVDILESKYDLVFPRSYKEYLYKMGKGAGVLFRYDHFAVTYDYITGLTNSEREKIREFSEYNVELPDNAFIISGRLGEQFLFIECTGDQDSKVLYYNEWDQNVVIAYESVYEWLDNIYAECIAAIESGYF